MHCRQCGELIDENAVICVKCGTKKAKGRSIAPIVVQK